MASNLPPGVEHSDPHFHEDVDQVCVCGHPRDCHDVVDGHEPCLWGWDDRLADEDEHCPCNDFQPDEEAPTR